jgi:glycosyltransferase involved in cell wall biosynthesis
VLSSDFEGLSNALLECMSMGIACISTRCEGSVDVIRNGENGLLVDIGDETGLMKAMCLLADDAGLRRKLERQAREDIRVYDKDIVTKSWEQVIRKTYENAASAGKGAPDVSHVL